VLVEAKAENPDAAGLLAAGNSAADMHATAVLDSTENLDGGLASLGNDP
jgi:hypothetical protein